MKHHFYILILLFLIEFQSYGQILESKVVYELKSRHHEFIPDSTVYKDSIDLNPFKLLNKENELTIFIDGLEQNFRFDIMLTREDTTAFITSYTYQINSVKPSKEDKKMFPNYRIDKKEEWKLISKVTPITDTIVNSTLSIINYVHFDSLPSRETMLNDIKLSQLDGHGFRFNIKSGNQNVRYSVNSLYLNRHEKLKELKPIESLLLDYLKSKEELKVEYLKNACYNSGSIMWICK